MRLLTENGITAVLSATVNPPNQLPRQVARQICLKCGDQVEQALPFDEICAFVRREKELGGIAYVHCGAGISRAATCTISCLVEIEGLTLSEAFSWVKTCRPFINPNAGFRKQLEERYGGLCVSQNAFPWGEFKETMRKKLYEGHIPQGDYKGDLSFLKSIASA